MAEETAPSVAPTAVDTVPAERPIESSPETAAEKEQTDTTAPIELPAETSQEVPATEEQPESTATEQPAEQAPEVATENEQPAEEAPEAATKDEQPKTPLSKLFVELPQILADANHREMWGIELTDASSVSTAIILQKFLRANNDDAAKAKTQLAEALKWRKDMNPQVLLTETEHNKEKFGGLGYVTAYKSASGQKEIITWNIYGAVKDVSKTFDSVDEYELSKPYVILC